LSEEAVESSAASVSREASGVSVANSDEPDESSASTVPIVSSDSSTSSVQQEVDNKENETDKNDDPDKINEDLRFPDGIDDNLILPPPELGNLKDELTAK